MRAPVLAMPADTVVKTLAEMGARQRAGRRKRIYDTNGQGSSDGESW